MENRIADGGIGANIAELAEALDAGRMDLVVLLRQQDHFDAGNVGIHRQQIIGEVVIDMAVRGVIVPLGSDLSSITASAAKQNGTRLRLSVLTKVMRSGSEVEKRLIMEKSRLRR